jgi:hypothetical protein
MFSETSTSVIFRMHHRHDSHFNAFKAGLNVASAPRLVVIRYNMTGCTAAIWSRWPV